MNKLTALTLTTVFLSLIAVTPILAQDLTSMALGTGLAAGGAVGAGAIAAKPVSNMIVSQSLTALGYKNLGIPPDANGGTIKVEATSTLGTQVLLTVDSNTGLVLSSEPMK